MFLLWLKKRGLIHENIVPSLNQISGIRSSCHSYIDPIDNHCLTDFLIFINKIKQPHIKLALLLNLLIPLRHENLLRMNPIKKLIFIDDIPVLRYSAEELKTRRIGDRPIYYPIPSDLTLS